MYIVLLILTTIIPQVTALCGYCPNHCSGHGSCGALDICKCFSNWGNGLTHINSDCSERVCPYDIAWVDQPDLLKNYHRYRECSGQGICNRESGECECFDRYYGAACQWQGCPNQCSGHGSCEYIEDTTYAATWNDYSSTGLYDYANPFQYFAWDRRKQKTCVCDPLWGDSDCSKKLCPYGNDVLALRPDETIGAYKNQKQQIRFNFPLAEVGNIDGKTFALSFKSKVNETYTTYPIVFETVDMTLFANNVKNALKNLPNRVIDGCDVVATKNSAQEYLITVEWTSIHLQGKQNLLIVHDWMCNEGCTPRLDGIPVEVRSGQTNSRVIELQASEYNSYECGRRGKCDYTTGTCKCFSGYGGDTCNIMHALY